MFRWTLLLPPLFRKVFNILEQSSTFKETVSHTSSSRTSFLWWATDSYASWKSRWAHLISHLEKSKWIHKIETMFISGQLSRPLWIRKLYFSPFTIHSPSQLGPHHGPGRGEPYSLSSEGWSNPTLKSHGLIKTPWLVNATHCGSYFKQL